MATLASAKASAKRFKERIDALIIAGETQENRGKTGNADKLSRYLEHYRKSHHEIVTLSVLPVDSNEIEINAAAEADYLLDVEDKIYEWRAREESGKEAGGRESGNSNGSNVTRAKLPKLELETFSGNMLYFTSYWASFLNNVDTRPDLTIKDKFSYLVMSLKDGSGACIAGLERTEENYEKAKIRIQSRYGDVQARISAHFKALNEIRSANSVTANLRQTYDNIETHLANLESLKESMDSKSILEIIRSKFPSNVLIAIEETVLSGETMSVELFRTRLQRYIAVREKCEGLSTFEPKFKGANSRNPQLGRSFSLPNSPLRSGAYLTGASPAQGKRAPPGNCIFCESPHWNDDCSNYVTVAERKQRLRGRCYSCFSKEHTADNCTNIRPCRHCGDNRHHRSLCEKYLQKVTKEAALVGVVQGESVPVVDETALETHINVVNTNIETYLPTASVTLSPPLSDKKLVVKLLLDTGAQATFITQRVAKVLGLRPEGRVSINLFRFGTSEAVSTSCAKVTVKLYFRGGWLNVKAIVVPFITNKIFSDRYYNELQAVRRRFPNLTISGASREGDVEVLIGADLYYYLVGPRLLAIRPGLFLSETRFGFVMVGRERETEIVMPDIVSLTVGINDDSRKLKTTEFDLARFWDLDSVGIRQETDFDDDTAVGKFSDTVEFIEGRYWVSWPWRKFPPDLPNNYYLAKGRLRSLVTRLNLENRITIYDKAIQDQLEAGVIERVHDRAPGLEHYLPHLPVTREEKTTKLRVVYDASARCRKGAKSLNDCLFRGRVLLEDQMKVLIRFRREGVAIAADVEKAFLQLALRTEDDRNVVRFLWLKKLGGRVEDSNLQIFRFKRVVFGVNASPFLLNAVVHNHIRGAIASYPELETVLPGLYVDNLALSLNDRRDAFKLYYTSRKVFAAASMNLREWYSNDPDLKSMVRECGDYAFKNDDCVGVLGYTWNSATDVMSLTECMEWDCLEPCTKRRVASFVSGIYDPLGLVGPVTMSGKVILRKLWVAGMDWDQPVPGDLSTEWAVTSTFIRNSINAFSIPRWCAPCRPTRQEIHCFADASQTAYAACIYVRSTSDSITYSSHLIMSKNRLAPLSRQNKSALSIPRLELLAATVGARLISLVREQFPMVGRTVLWSDSQCVLRWIRSTKLLPLFEENRVKQIKAVASVEFRYVPTKLNPADLLTRQIADPSVVTSSMWLNGPEFLSEEEDLWPVWMPDRDPPADADVWGTETATALLLRSENCEARPPYGIDIARYTSLGRLLRITVYCNRFVGIRVGSNENVNVNKGFVYERELRYAMLMWIEYIHRSRYPDYFTNLPVRNNPLRLVLDSTLTDIYGDELSLPVGTRKNLWLTPKKLRLTTRLANSALDFSEKNPVVLPEKHPFTSLVIRSMHYDAHHAGALNTLTRVRRMFYVCKGKSEARRVVGACFVCHRMRCGPYKMPDFPDLPEYRVTKSFPFTNCGLDGLGPFRIRTMNGQCNIYILQITCLVTRAVYLAPLDDLSGEAFLCRLREFAGRYNLPSIIVCDNAKAFKSVAGVSQKVWLKLVTSPTVQEFSTPDGRRIVWKFIPALAPWTGGVYERLNAMIKRCFYHSFGESKLTRLQFDAVVAEIQGVLNSRPLCEIDEYDGYLTPSHFLCVPVISRGPVIDKGGLEPSTKLRIDLLRVWRRGLRILDQFWVLWRQNYLKSLVGARKWVVKQGRVTSRVLPQIGEPVLVSENLPRQMWRVGRICELFRGEDGFVRSCLVRTLGGATVHRSICQLYPYESRFEEFKELSFTTPGKVGTSEKLSENSEEASTPVGAQLRDSDVGETFSTPLVRWEGDPVSRGENQVSDRSDPTAGPPLARGGLDLGSGASKDIAPGPTDKVTPSTVRPNSFARSLISELSHHRQDKLYERRSQSVEGLDCSSGRGAATMEDDPEIDDEDEDLKTPTNVAPPVDTDSLAHSAGAAPTPPLAVLEHDRAFYRADREIRRAALCARQRLFQLAPQGGSRRGGMSSNNR